MTTSPSSPNVSDHDFAAAVDALESAARDCSFLGAFAPEDRERKKSTLRAARSALLAQFEEVRAKKAKMQEAVETSLSEIGYLKNQISHPNGKRAHHIDSVDQTRLDALDEAEAAIRTALNQAEAGR